MKITQIRNATLIIEYAGKRFLTDPMLGPKGSSLHILLRIAGKGTR